MRIGGRNLCRSALALVVLGVTAATGAAQALDEPDVSARVMPREGTLARPLASPATSWIVAAQALPAAQAAVERMAASGYVRVPDADAVAARDGHAFVTLAFTDPANAAHAPLVLVATDATAGSPRTWVAGGVFAVDPATQDVVLAPDATDADLFVVDTSVADGRAFAPDGIGGPSLKRWAACTLVGCGAALGGCMRVGGLVGLPPTAQAGCALAGCGLAGFLCMW